MPSIKEDISKISKEIKQLDKDAKEAAQSTKQINNQLKFDPTNIQLVKQRFESLNKELVISKQKVAELYKQQAFYQNQKNTGAYKIGVETGKEAEALRTINAILDDIKVKIAYAEEKQDALANATDKTKEKQELLNAAVGQVKKKYETATTAADNFASAVKRIYLVAKLFITSSIETGTELYTLSKRFNSSVEDIQVWNKTLELATKTENVFTDSMNSLVKVMAQISSGRGVAYQNTLKAIGVSYEEIAELTPAEQFQAIVEGLANVENYSLRVAYAQELLGEKGQYLASVLDNGLEGLEEYKEKAENYARLTEEQTEALVELRDVYDELKTEFIVVMADLAIALAPTIETILDIVKALVPFIELISKGISSLGKVGGVLLVVLGGTAIILPKILRFLSYISTVSIAAASGVNVLTASFKMLTSTVGGWVTMIISAISLLAMLIGLIKTAKEETEQEDPLKDLVTESQGVIGGSASDYTTSVEETATKSSSYEITLNATITGEGETKISDDNAVKVATLTATEINKSLGDLIK